MPPNQTTPSLPQDNYIAVRACSGMCLLAGLWFFLSPWAFGTQMDAGVANCRLVGGAIFVLAAARVLRPASLKVFSWINMLLGVWVCFSPLLFHYGEHLARVFNSLAVGLMVVAFAIASTRVFGMRGTGLPHAS